MTLLILCAGADGEEDGGLAEVLRLLLALLLWNWYCNSSVTQRPAQQAS